jgi:predicted alternative tryptophan synthase beta-subunit
MAIPDDVVQVWPYLSPTPLRSCAGLDAAVGNGIRVLVKHENSRAPGEI